MTVGGYAIPNVCVEETRTAATDSSPFCGRRCNRIAYTRVTGPLQKAAKRTVKSRLLQGERPSFAKQTKTTNIMGTVKAPRNTSVELLRFAFMYLILLLHAYIHGTELDYERIYLWGANPGTAPHLALFSLSQIGVTGFMFMSGYYGIHATRGKAANLILTALFWLLILTPIGGGFGKLLYLHPFDGWWFVSAYLFVMCLSPLIEAGIKAVPQQTFRNVVIAMLAYTYIAKTLDNAHSTDVVLLLTIYLAARYFRLHLSVKICKQGGGKTA